MTVMDDSQAAASMQPPYLTTPAIRQRLDLLSHLLEFGHQMVVVQGETGSGRSRLLGAVAAQARPNWRVIPGNGAPTRSAAALLEALTEALELGDLDAGVDDLRARLAEIELGGQLCILTLDDAESLDDEARAMLFSLAYSEHQRGDLRIVISGDADSDFGERLQAAAPEGAVIHVVDLPPLEIEELKTLALSVLPAAGGESPLDDGLDLDQLALAAAGNPGRMLASLRNGGHKPINPGERAVAAARAMGGALRGFNVRKYTAVLAAAAFVLVAVAIGMLLASRHTENTKPGTVEISLPAPNLEAPPVATDDALPAAATAVTSTASQQAPSETLSVAEQGPFATSATAPVIAAPEAPAESLPAEPVHEVSPPAESLAPDPSVAEVPAAPAPSVAPKPKQKKITEPRTITAANKAASEPASATQHVGKSVSSKTGADESKSFYSSAWVKRQKPQSFVVQLFGSRDRASTTRFIRDHGIGEKATVVEVTLKGAPWYVVVTGLYTTRTAATAAIHAMPAPLAKQQPWPRAVSTLK